MDLMGFHIVDVIIVALVAFLAIKGLVNGFTKELFNFITIVAGITVASRYNEMVINFINKQQLIPTIPNEFTKIIGFIIIIIAIWSLLNFISSIITKLTSKPVGFFSRLMGYFLAAGRYLFVFSLIIFGMSQSNFFKKTATKFKTETKLFEPMSKIGGQILNIDFKNNKLLENNSTNNNEMNLTIKPSSSLVEHNSSN